MPDEFSIEKQHEPDSVRVGWVGAAVAGLGILVVLSAVLMTVLDVVFSIRERKTATPALPIRQPARLASFPSINPVQANELRAMRAAEDRLLTTYEWVDRKAGVARIPIARAMDLVVARGFSGVNGDGKKRSDAHENAAGPREESKK